MVRGTIRVRVRVTYVLLRDIMVILLNINSLVTLHYDIRVKNGVRVRVRVRVRPPAAVSGSTSY